jgi:hypothetical protein
MLVVSKSEKFWEIIFRKYQQKERGHYVEGFKSRASNA